MIIEFSEVSKSFQTGFFLKSKNVLNNFSFDVVKGELCGFLGLNGAGKSTSLKLLLQFLNLDSGNISLNLNGESFYQKLNQIGFLPEQPALMQSFTGLETLKYLSDFYSNYSFEPKRVREIAKRLNIDHALEQKVATYSKGMTQRLSFMTSFIHGPKLLVLDEPFSGLDPLGRIEIKNILKELNCNGTTVLFTSHIVSDLEEISTSLVVLKDGTNSYSGKLNDLLRRNNKNEKIIKLYNNCPEIDEIQEIALAIDGKNICTSEKNAEKIIEILNLKNIKINTIESKSITLEEIVYDF